MAQKLPTPIGLMAATDPIGIRIMNVCRHINIRIPDDIAVLEVDNDVHLCSVAMPTLSSLDHNAVTIGYEVARLLDLRMEGEATPPFPIMISPGKIFTRQSTDLIAVEDPLVAEILLLYSRRSHAWHSGLRCTGQIYGIRSLASTSFSESSRTDTGTGDDSYTSEEVT